MMEKNKLDIEMADMVGKTYFKVATWFNQDFDTDAQRQEALKHVSAEIIQTILEDAFLQIDGVVDTELKIVKKGTPEKTVNKTFTGTGKMFNINEDAIIKGLNKQK